MIEFTVILHNAVARKNYLTIQSNAFTVDIDGFQTDWQLKCMPNVLMQLKELTMSFSILKLHFNEQKVSFVTLLSTFYNYFTSGDRKCINYCIHCRNWNTFIIFNVILDFLHFTTKATPSLRPSQHDMHADINVDTPPPYSLITNTVTQFLGRNLMKNLLGKYVRWCVDWGILNEVFECNIKCICFYSETYLLLSGWIATWQHIIFLVGGGG